MAKNKTQLDNTKFGKDKVRTEMEVGETALENWQFLMKLEIHLWPAIPLLSVYEGEVGTCMHQKL